MDMKKPIYQQIKEELQAYIEGLAANTPIPGERELAARFHVSRMTLRKAVAQLEQEGYLYREMNRGTFVADKKLRKQANIVPSLEADHCYRYKILYFDIKERSESDVQYNLEIAFDEYILRVVRLVLNENIPVCIEEIYCARKNISDEQLGNLNAFLNMDQYTQKGSIRQTFLPMMIPTQYASLLHLKINTPIIRVDSLIHKKDGRPFIYIKSYNHPEMKRIENTL